MRILELLAQVVGSDKRYDKQYAKCYIANICGNHFFSGEAFDLLPLMGKGPRIFGHSAYKWKIL